MSPAVAGPLRATRPPARTTSGRTQFRVLEARPRRNGRLLRIAAAAIVAAALLAVVVAHSLLAEGQVRLTAEQSQLAAEQAVHRQLLASVAQAEDPASIIAEANKLNLVEPSSVTQLPAVSLNAPLSIAGAAGPTTSGSAAASATATP